MALLLYYHSTRISNGHFLSFSKTHPFHNHNLKERFSKSNFYFQKIKNENLIAFSKSFSTSNSIETKLKGEMKASYNPKEVESGWYEWWLNQGYFQPEIYSHISKTLNSSETSPPKEAINTKIFSLVFPPPNITGSLHIGHALTATLQDSLARWKRMNGEQVAFIPGLDHASIATQVVVEKKLKKEMNVTRLDLGREKFLEEVWKWKELYGSRIKEQLKKTGASLDWSREVFTMDPVRSKAVNECFIRLFNAGLIYRNTKLVNWCCALQTVISDIEIEYIELDKKTLIPLQTSKGLKQFEFGLIYKFSFPVEGGGNLELLTTRPETMFGDTAVAIHPDDERYKQFHNKFVIHPLTNKKIPIITDKTLVNPTFGTGVVKITPAHDFNDYACALRHNLPQVTILNLDGTLNENAGEFAGVNRLEARDLVVEKLIEKGCFLGKDSHPMRLARCSRSGDILEPLLYPQWYVKTTDLAKISYKLVENGTVEILPTQFKEEWFRWLGNIHDWCISRQLWWGHRIPAYQVNLKNSQNKDQEIWIATHSEEEAHEIALTKYKLEKDSYFLKQDEDVFDTWFSSGLYPISSFGWPSETPDLQKFYPLSLMETGSDIIFFWVARMSMLCTYLTKKHPFEKIYLHPLVRDAKGRKMSKSLGNVIDPLDIIFGKNLEELQSDLVKSNMDPEEQSKALKLIQEEYPQGIPECGADSLRFSLAAYTEQTRSINLDISRIYSYRKFCNKLWNATKFILSQLGTEGFISYRIPHFGQLELMDRWILSRLVWLVTQCNCGFETLNFSVPALSFYEFFLHELCDYYLEYTKLIFKKKLKLSNSDYTIKIQNIKAILFNCLEISLRLVHPLMPYISEELWQRLPFFQNSRPIESIMLAPYPQVSFIQHWQDKQTESQVQRLQLIIQSARSLRQDYQIQELCSFVILTGDSSLIELVNQEKQSLLFFCKASSLEIVQIDPELKDSAVRVVDHSCKLILPTSTLNQEKALMERQKLEKQLQKTKETLSNLEILMNSSSYKEKVRSEVQARDKERRAKLEGELHYLNKTLMSLNRMDS